MTPDLRCYGDDIQALAALVPDVDLRSPMDIHGWYRGEWQHIAEPLGFAQQLAAAPTAIPTTADRAAAMTLTGLAAFERSLHEARAGVTDLQARAQSTVLQQLTTAGHERGELWRVTADCTRAWFSGMPGRPARSECSNAVSPARVIAVTRSRVVGTARGAAANCWAKPLTSAIACHSRPNQDSTSIGERRSKSGTISAAAWMSSP